MTATRNMVKGLTADEWISEWRALGEQRQLRCITACVLAVGEDSTVIQLLRVLAMPKAAEPEAPKRCAHGVVAAQCIHPWCEHFHAWKAAEPEAKAHPSYCHCKCCPVCAKHPNAPEKCKHYYGEEGGYCFSSDNVIGGRCGAHR